MFHLFRLFHPKKCDWRVQPWNPGGVNPGIFMSYSSKPGVQLLPVT